MRLDIHFLESKYFLKLVKKKFNLQLYRSRSFIPIGIIYPDLEIAQPDNRVRSSETLKKTTANYPGGKA